MKTKYFEFPKELKQYNFVELYRKEQNPILKIRYLALSHLMAGKSIREVSKLMYVDYGTIVNWAEKVKNTGISDLLNKPRGCRRKFPKSKLSEFKNEVQKLQAKKTEGRITAKDIKKLIEEKYNYQCSVTTIYNLLAASGLNIKKLSKYDHRATL